MTAAEVDVFEAWCGNHGAQRTVSRGSGLAPVSGDGLRRSRVHAVRDLPPGGFRLPAGFGETKSFAKI